MQIHCSCGQVFKPSIVGRNQCPSKRCGKWFTCKTIPKKKIKEA